MPRKKSKIPPALRFIRWIFPYVERIAPQMAYAIAIRIFFSPFRVKTPTAEKEFVKSGNRFEISIAGKKIVGFSWGKGDTILCVHGWAGRGSMFLRFVDPLVQKGFRVVVFDGPSHGLSEGVSTDVIEFEEALVKIESMFKPVVGFVTHSFGGTATLYRLSMHQDPRPIVFIAVPAVGEYVVQEFARRINSSLKVIKRLEEFTLKRYGKSFYDISAVNTSACLNNAPSLVIHDNNDEEVPVSHGEKLMETLTNATFIRTIGLGHNRILRDPSVVEKTAEFLAHHCK